MAILEDEDDANRCTRRKADGTRCKAKCRPGRAVCTFHSEDLKAKCREGRRRGGRNGDRTCRTLPEDTAPVELRTVGQLQEAMQTLYHQVRVGLVGYCVGTCLSRIALLIERLIEGHELAGRIADLEEQMGYHSNSRLQDKW
jgi:hypothetical protein